MAKDGSCLFKVGYFFYSRTRLGLIYHRRDIAKAREKYPNGQTHSLIEPKKYNDLHITPLPILLDNFAYLITDSTTKTSVVVDPGDPEPVVKYLKDVELTPDAVLVTHKHWDHSGGNAEMKQTYPKIKIYGGVHDKVNNVTNTVSDAEELHFGRLHFTVKFTPGHTVGHVVYILDGEPFGAPDSVFSGDHLFIGGCGRMFEAPADTMLKSLDSMSTLPKETLVWPGHEYAKENLDFACSLDENNTDAKEKYDAVENLRHQSLCTCPSTIQEELSYNPFLRTNQESVLKAVGMVQEGEFQVPEDSIRARALQELRTKKDSYKYKL